MSKRKYATNAERQAAYRERHGLTSPKTRECVMCGKPFEFRSGCHVKYCSSRCRQKAYRLRKFYRELDLSDVDLSDLE
jgi:hypothetical protein